jgi:hypothetical protein
MHVKSVAAIHLSHACIISALARERGHKEYLLLLVVLVRIVNSQLVRGFNFAPKGSSSFELCLLILEK